MAKRAGIVGVEIEPVFSGLAGKIDSEARKLKPLGVRVDVDGAGLNRLGLEVQSTQRKLDTISTRAAQNELKVLGATADRELSRVQANVRKIGGSSGSVFDGTSTLPRGFASSKQVTTVVPSLVTASEGARALDTLETSAQRVRPAISRVGSTVSDLGGKLSSGASQLGRFTSDLGLLSGGFAVAEIAGQALTSFIDTNLQQTAEGIDKLTASGERLSLLGLFDPTNADAYAKKAKEIAGILGEVTRVEPQNTFDKIGSAVGVYDLGLFGDSQQEGNQAEARAKEIEKLTANLTALGEVAGRSLLDTIRGQMIALGVSSKETDATLAPLYDQIADEAAANRGAAALEKVSTEVERLGVKIDPTASKWANFATVLGGIFDPIQNALSAQEALADGQETLAKAQKKYEDIVNGNTEGLKSAAEALRSARDDLAKAVAETGPGSKAARDAAGDVRDALRAYRDLQVEIGKGPAGGDFFDPRTQDLQDAYDKILDTQEKLKEIESGNSDQVVSARDRVTDAQKRYNDELAKTGPNSEEAQAALEDVTDAERALPGLVLDVETANARLREEMEKHPEAIQASIDQVNEWQRRGLISVDVANRWRQELLLAAAAAQQLTDSLPNQAGIYTAEQWANYGGGNAPRPPSGSPAPKPPQTMTIPEGKAAGLPGVTYPQVATTAKDSQGRSWKWDPAQSRWVAQFASGGVVPGFTLGDTVPAMLTPGEGVVNRQGMAALGTDNLQALNRGEGLSGGVELLERLCAGQDALRQELVNLVRTMLVTPDAGVAWLQAIEANTRRATAGPSVASVQARAAEFA